MPAGEIPFPRKAPLRPRWSKRKSKEEDKLEARGGIEPPIKVLQTFALPLGYRAVRKLTVIRPSVLGHGTSIDSCLPRILKPGLCEYEALKPHLRPARSAAFGCMTASGLRKILDGQYACVSWPWQRRRVARSAIHSRSARQLNCPIRSTSRRNSAPCQSPANT